MLAWQGTCREDLLKVCKEECKESAKEAYLKLSGKVKKVFIVGNSFGGNLAFYLAKEFGDQISGIVSLGTPIRLRFHNFIKFRLYTYGLLKKFYKKRPRHYALDYTDMSDEITYSFMPTKSVREFFKLIEEETIPNLPKVKVPTFIGHASVDPVVAPESATYIHEHIGSSHKIIFWFNSSHHTLFSDKKRDELFVKIHDFIKSIV